MTECQGRKEPRILKIYEDVGIIEKAMKMFGRFMKMLLLYSDCDEKLIEDV